VPTAQFDIKDLSGKQAVWKLLVYSQRLRLVPPADHVPLPYDVHRPEAPDRIELIDLVIVPLLLSVKLNDAAKKKTPFRLDRAAFAAVQKWLGYEPALRTALKHRMAWSMTIGLLFIMASIPIGRADELGYVPFNPVNLGLGLALIALAAASKLKPHRNFFLLDACWILVLAASTLHGLLRGGPGVWWYPVLVLQLLFVVGGVRQFRRFARTPGPSTPPTPATS
jgi:hypothetical protein